MRRLKDAKGPLANFLASGLLCLKEKLGPILWQLPPQLKFDAARLREFFELLPRDTAELARLAEQHDSWMDGRAALDPDALRPVRHAVEFRHESFLTGEFISLLREFNVAMVVADADSKFPTAEDITADWVYVRLHGEREGHESGYTAKEIAAWAKKIETWRAGGEPEPAKGRRVAEPMPASAAPKDGRDMFVFFDNTEEKELSPVNARAMAEKLGVGPGESPEDVMKELGTSKPAKKKVERKKKASP